ncbi:MAG: GNAT family N-acetyltransferase [Actinomycetota bacterium]|nr:GNAT family N-acetyltransferase [Actinomycetota bacterium]
MPSGPRLQPTPALTGDVVRLEPLELRHLDGLTAAAAEERRTYHWTFVPDGRDAMAAYVELALQGRADDLFTPFATVRLDDERVVGSTRFLTERWDWSGSDPTRQRANTPDVVEIGWTWLAASAQRTAVNTEAKLLMLTHAFETWRVHRVCLRTDRRNERSRSAIERLGARLDGVIRAERPGSDGSVRDTAHYSITADEWPAVRAELSRRLGRRATG